jgi:hypothetical protein
MIALLSGGRLGEPADKSVDHGARHEQITHCAKVLAVLGLCQRSEASASRPVRPGYRNEGSTAVGQHRQQQRHAPPLQAADDGKAASFKGMPPADDDD